MVPLDLLAPGECADVAEVCGSPAWVRRMAELGIQCGSRVKVLRPGIPCVVEIGSARYCVRGDCDCQILVQPVNERLP